MIEICVSTRTTTLIKEVMPHRKEHTKLINSTEQLQQTYTTPRSSANSNFEIVFFRPSLFYPSTSIKEREEVQSNHPTMQCCRRSSSSEDSFGVTAQQSRKDKFKDAKKKDRSGSRDGRVIKKEKKIVCSSSHCTKPDDKNKKKKCVPVDPKDGECCYVVKDTKCKPAKMTKFPGKKGCVVTFDEPPKLNELPKPPNCKSKLRQCSESDIKLYIPAQDLDNLCKQSGCKLVKPKKKSRKKAMYVLSIESEEIEPEKPKKDKFKAAKDCILGKLKCKPIPPCPPCDPPSESETDDPCAKVYDKVCEDVCEDAIEQMKKICKKKSEKSKPEKCKIEKVKPEKCKPEKIKPEKCKPVKMKKCEELVCNSSCDSLCSDDLNSSITESSSSSSESSYCDTRRHRNYVDCNRCEIISSGSTTDKTKSDGSDDSDVHVEHIPFKSSKKGQKWLESLNAIDRAELQCHRELLVQCSSSSSILSNDDIEVIVEKHEGRNKGIPMNFNEYPRDVEVIIEKSQKQNHKG